MIYAFLANGFEEIEAISVIDILRRAGVDIKTVGVEGDCVKGTHGIELRCDCCLNEISSSEAEGVVLPGGMPGTTNLLKSEKVCDAIRDAYSKGKLIGAICAAPSILGEIGILSGKNVCCYPGFESKLKLANISLENVCVDGNIITSKGPGTAIEFSLEIVKYLKGTNVKDKIQEQLQWKM